MPNFHNDNVNANDNFPGALRVPFQGRNLSNFIQNQTTFILYLFRFVGFLAVGDPIRNLSSFSTENAFRIHE